MNTIDERRKHKRYRVQDGIFASIPSDFLVGQVKNVSKGGISFTYIATEKELNSKPTLEIFSRDRGFHLREIPFRVVSDGYVLNQNPCSSLQMKSLGAAFVDLTAHQASQLDLFIRTYAAAEA